MSTTINDLHLSLLNAISMLRSDISSGILPTDVEGFHDYVTQNHTLLKETLKKCINELDDISVDLMLKLERHDILLALDKANDIISVTFENPLLLGSYKTYSLEICK